MNNFLRFLLLLSSFVTIIITGNVTCPSGFKLVNNQKCLKIFSTRLKHLEAEQDCGYLGGTLVTIKNAIDNRQITNLAASTSISSVWIGVFCFASQNTSLCYHDDQTGALNYSNFAAGNPNVGQGYGGCVYLQTTGQNAGQWFSAPCEIVGMSFVCEVPLTKFDDNCSRNYNGYCYLRSDELQLTTINTTYSQAQSICRSKNAELVSIHSKPEIDYVKAIYMGSGIDRIYLGAQSTLTDIFNWDDGSNWDYDNFDPLVNQSANCLQMDLSNRIDNGMWRQISCQEANYFLCKREIGDSVKAVKMKDAVLQNKAPPKSRPNVFDFSQCNTTLYMAPGVITSVGYPSPSAKEIFCTWKVVTVGAYRVGLYFTDFYAYYNTVKIYDERGQILQSPSGKLSPFSVLSPTNIVVVTYDSWNDAFYGSYGFEAIVLPY